MKMYILPLALVVAALVLSASPAHAIVIDFESLAPGAQGSSVSEDGFTLTSTLNPNGLYTSDSTGSTALFENYIFGAVTELALTGGGAFSLNSIDLAELQGNGVVPVTFTGDLTGGGTVTQTFTLDGVAFGAETFTFTGFNSVTKVSWGQGFDPPFHQFDNIVASAINGNAVPEPASLGLLGLGLAGLALIRRGARLQPG